ncbi:uncharacterized protein LOC113228164 isoform X2 [Hyposmocoma kahamanoa]|uniref:uncharacterized protein LOC113228164 isoform X2 n=1 Tax=Hyposmocoma kahamanoa TaxID=1477025 RepID=UPI000E6D64B3|nr:uncharacterized protein LOC113228164 isoform X2 [Hyposmocoma kahamanoa]
MISNCLLLFVFSSVVGASADCVFSLKEDFGNPSPVLLRKGSYLSPNNQGDVRLGRGEVVLIGCPGDRQAEVHCVANKTVRFGAGWTGDFKEIRCKTQPWITTEDIGTCYGVMRNHRVGYKVRGEFYSLYEACFDMNLLSTLYVKHHVSPTNKFVQPGSRPKFIEGTVFGKMRMSKLYKFAHQKAQLSALLGEEISDKQLTKKQFLTRGHLAPRADFSLRAQQRASFHYINTGPQWLRGNAGDWAALEDSVRSRAHRHNLTLTVYTGTHGVLSLPNAKNVSTPIYLAKDDNNNDIVPVPLYFFKVIYDPVGKTATAFIIINSPYINNKMISDMAFCNDVCEMNPNFSWLRWRDDGAYSFCCTYKELAEEVELLPRLDVKGLFY